MAGLVYLQGSGQPSARLLEPLWPRLVARAHADSRRPRVAVVTAALHGISGVVSRVAGWFTGRGLRVGGDQPLAERVALPGEAGAMSAGAARAAILGADLVWLTGGDPVAGARLLRATGADAWLREARAAGVTLGGGSAGAILLGAFWASWPDRPHPDAAFDGGELVAMSGAVGDLVVDTHAERDDWEELRLVDGMLTAAGKRCRLRGIPTDGALLIDGEDRLSELGEVFALR